MWAGRVTSISIAAAKGEPMTALDHVVAVAGRGLEGDRYYFEQGFYSYHPGPIREVSLIEEEALEALRRDHQLDVASGVTRRNIVTRGVPLNHLVGKEFRIGEAILRGVKLCEPCAHLVEVAGIASLLSTFIHRGGMHAQIVGGGTIRVGDAIEEVAG